MPTTTVNGLGLFWRDAGAGQPIVLLMGLETDHRGWSRVARALKQEFRCISPDNRDVGLSGTPSAGYRIADLADDTIGLIDHLGLDKVTLIGQSMGGAIAQELARKFPDRIERMVLISSFSRLDARARSALQAWKAIRGKVSLSEYYTIVFPWMYTADEYAKPGFIDPILLSAAANPNPQGAEAFGRHVDAVVNFDSSSWLHQLAAETLIVSGEQDAITPPTNAYQLASGIPFNRLVLVKGAGHGLAMTPAIDPVIPAISNFIRQSPNNESKHT